MAEQWKLIDKIAPHYEIVDRDGSRIATVEVRPNSLRNGLILSASQDLLAALEPFAWLARVMEPGEMLNHRGVSVSYEQVQAAAAAVARARGEGAA